LCAPVEVLLRSPEARKGIGDLGLVLLLGFVQEEQRDPVLGPLVLHVLHRILKSRLGGFECVAGDGVDAGTI
jgi:hypothetical protein